MEKPKICHKFSKRFWVHNAKKIGIVHVKLYTNYISKGMIRNLNRLGFFFKNTCQRYWTSNLKYKKIWSMESWALTRRQLCVDRLSVMSLRAVLLTGLGPFPTQEWLVTPKAVQLNMLCILVFCHADWMIKLEPPVTWSQHQLLIGCLYKTEQWQLPEISGEHTPH